MNSNKEQKFITFSFLMPILDEDGAIYDHLSQDNEDIEHLVEEGYKIVHFTQSIIQSNQKTVFGKEETDAFTVVLTVLLERDIV